MSHDSTDSFSLSIYFSQVMSHEIFAFQIIDGKALNCLGLKMPKNENRSSFNSISLFFSIFKI